MNGFSIEKSLIFTIGILLVIDYLFKKKEGFENETNYLDTIECTPNNPPQKLMNNYDPNNKIKATINISSAYIHNKINCRQSKITYVNLFESMYTKDKNENNLQFDDNLYELIYSNTNSINYTVNLVIVAGYKITFIKENTTIVLAATETSDGVFSNSEQIKDALNNVQTIIVSSL
jgi:hypothetical protein